MKKKLIGLLMATVTALGAAQAPIATASEPSGGSARWCAGGQAFFGDFEHARSQLDKRYPRNGRVWQAPNDSAVWSEWCLFSNGKAVMRGTETTPSRVTFRDGTVASFRASSKSGGYTIDFNTPTHTKNWKIHVA